MDHGTFRRLCRRGIPSAVILLVALVGPVSSETRGDDWPQFRGPHSDNHVTGFTAPATWPKELKKGWSAPVGDGVSSPALVGNRIYTFTRKGGDEVITCIDAVNGQVVWSDKYEAVEVTRPAAGLGGPDKFTGPRSSPAVVEGKVCSFGVGGILSCLDASSGKLAWRHDTKGKPMFFTACSPTIAEGKCIVYTGTTGFGGKGGKGGGGKGGAGKVGGGKGGAMGKGDITSYDLATGDVKWKMPGEGPGYGSPVVATIAGVKQIVVLGEANLMGVGLEDGKLLWKTPFSQGRYQTATPILDGDVVIISGSAYKIEKKDGEFTATRIWKDQAPHQYNTPVLKDGVLYGYMPAGQGTQIYAQDAKTGKVLWNDGAKGRQCGSILDAGSVLIALSDDGNLRVFKPSKEEYKEVATYKVAESGTWAMPIVSGKQIFVKDRENLTEWTIE
ncbi:MAG TPA: PQQ-binding-like beta-propeller repeat protein [Gemmata sp.]|nr:PQQ-binding-like beta-propeller repeat protein [Gemmata sp.]